MCLLIVKHITTPLSLPYISLSRSLPLFQMTQLRAQSQAKNFQDIKGQNITRILSIRNPQPQCKWVVLVADLGKKFVILWCGDSYRGLAPGEWI